MKKFSISLQYNMINVFNSHKLYIYSNKGTLLEYMPVFSFIDNKNSMLSFYSLFSFSHVYIDILCERCGLSKKLF